MQTDAYSLLPPLCVLLPLVGGLLSFVFRAVAARLGPAIALANLGLAMLLVQQIAALGSVSHPVGGWGAPLGIDLRADGPAAAMLLVTGLVAAGISIYAQRYFDTRAGRAYWPLWLFLVTALNGLFLTRDLFNLYVTLELLGLSAVGLTALQGGREPLEAALRYLLAGLAGSLAYLLGVAIVYHAQGSVDIDAVGGFAGPAARAALVMMTVGLLIKSALLPFHFWLPSAHGSASAPVSAALSALVLKGAFLILMRLYVEVFPAEAATLYTPLSWLGGAAVIWGSIQAIVQERIKLLIAYSTVAQIGYLFLALPLVIDAGEFWAVILLLAAAHALAKAALFLAAGNLISACGSDRLRDLKQTEQPLPVTYAAIGIASVSIMGLPPSSGFNAKWMLLEGAIGQGRWGIAVVLLLGGLLSAVYVFRLVEYAVLSPQRRVGFLQLAPARELSPLLLALLAIALGVTTLPWLRLVGIGDVFGAALGR